MLLTKTFVKGQPVPWRFKPGTTATITWIEVVRTLLTLADALLSTIGRRNMHDLDSCSLRVIVPLACAKFL